MESSYIRGAMQAPYLYAIVIEDHISINTSTQLPIDLLATEIQEGSEIMTAIMENGGNIYTAPKILLYCCQCTRIQDKPLVSRNRLLDGLGAKVARLCMSRQKQLGNHHEVFSPLLEKSLSFLKEDLQWTEEYAETIFKHFASTLQSGHTSPIVMFSP